MELKGDPGKKALHHIVRSKIGNQLRAIYEECLSEPLPHGWLRLLMQIDRRQGSKRDERAADNGTSRSSAQDAHEDASSGRAASY
jgi:hypothetical protein